MSRAPSLVVTGVTTGRSTEVDGVVVEGDGDAGGHQRGHEPAGQRRRAARPAGGWCRDGAGGVAGGGRRVDAAARRRRPGRRHRAAGPPGGARRCDRPAAPSAGSGLGGLGRWPSVGSRSVVPMGPSSPGRRRLPPRRRARSVSQARLQGSREPNGAGVRRTGQHPPKGRPHRWTTNTSGWPEGSARASRPPRSSRATAPGWRWPARSARPARSSRSASSTRSCNRIDHGVWGGCSERERRRILKRRRSGPRPPVVDRAAQAARPSARASSSSRAAFLDALLELVLRLTQRPGQLRQLRAAEEHEDDEQDDEQLSSTE